MDYLPAKWLYLTLCIPWDRSLYLRFLDMLKLSHFHHIGSLPSKPTIPTYLNWLMAFRTWLTFSPIALSAADSVIESLHLQYWHFWPFFIYESKIIILNSHFRFSILTSTIKIPNRCLFIGGRYPITPVDYISVLMDIDSLVTIALVIFIVIGSLGTITPLYPNLICRISLPYPKRTFQRGFRPATLLCSWYRALGDNVPI